MKLQSEKPKWDLTPHVRQDKLGKLTYMTRAGGYVMVRRPRCIPFVLSEKEWRKLPPFEVEKQK